MEDTQPAHLLGQAQLPLSASAGRVTMGEDDFHTALRTAGSVQNTVPELSARASDSTPAEQISGCTPPRGYHTALLCRLKAPFEVRGAWISMNANSRALRANFHRAPGLQKDEARQKVQKKTAPNTEACNLGNYRSCLVTHDTLSRCLCQMPPFCQEIPAED